MTHTHTHTLCVYVGEDRKRKGIETEKQTCICKRERETKNFELWEKLVPLVPSNISFCFSVCQQGRVCLFLLCLFVS